MTSHVLLFVLLAAAAPPQGNPSQTRQVYSRCLHGVMRADLQQKVAPDTFKPKLASACQAEEAAFRSAIINDDVARGVRRAMAEQGAIEQVEDMRLNTAESYKDYFEANAVPR